MRYINLITIFALITGMTACDSNNHLNVSQPGTTLPPQPPAERQLLLTIQNGGDNYLGAWQLFDSSTLNAETVLATLEGEHYIGDGIKPHESGFVWNPATELFYAIIPNSSYVDNDLLVSFNPKTDNLNVLASTYHNGLRGYNQVPIVSPDGKSLIAVAQNGGKISKCPVNPSYCDHPGGLVHINIDEKSVDYLKFTEIYSFADYGTNPFDGLHNVNTRPILTSSGGYDSIFLIAEGYGWNINGVKTTVRGKPFALKPTNNSDWSLPWEIIGKFPLLSNENLTGKVSYDPLYVPEKDLFIWSTDVAGKEFYVESQFGLDGEHNLMLQDETSSGCYRPVGLIFPQGSYTYQLFCAGLDILNDYANKSYEGKLLGINQIFSNVGVLRSFSNWFFHQDSLSRLHPYSFSSSYDSSIFINASTQNPDDWYLKGLGFLSSEVVELDTINMGITKLFSGSQALGLSFVGRPALGGRNDDVISNRYLVQLARFGADYNQGAVIKYDRYTHSITKIPLGMKSIGVLRGKPFQLENKNILGGAVYLHDKKFDPANEDYKSTAYVIDLNGKVSVNKVYTPSLTYKNGNDIINYHADYMGNNIDFSTTKSGEIWTTAYYPQQGQLPGVKGPGVGILRFDPKTGISNEGYLLEPFHGYSKTGHFPTSVTALGNKLFLTHTLEENEMPIESGFCVDLDDRDSENIPRYTFTPLSGNGRMFSEANLTRTLVGGATVVNGKMFVMTVPDTSHMGGGDDARIHEIYLNDCSNAGPFYSTHVAGLVDLASTRLVPDNNSLLYYGTSNGKLMRFNTADNSVIEMANLEKMGGKSKIKGYLLHTSLNSIAGIVFDYDMDEKPVGRRAFQYFIDKNEIKFSDVSRIVPSTESFVGFIEVKR